MKQSEPAQSGEMREGPGAVAKGPGEANGMVSIGKFGTSLNWGTQRGPPVRNPTPPTVLQQDQSKEPERGAQSVNQPIGGGANDASSRLADIAAPLNALPLQAQNMNRDADNLMPPLL